MFNLRLNVCAQVVVMTTVFIAWLMLSGVKVGWFVLPSIVLFVLGVYHTLNYIQYDDIFSVKGVVWCLLLYFYSVAPILHYTNEYYYHGFPIKFNDWDNYLLVWGGLNVIGVGIYSKIITLKVNSHHKRRPFFSIDDLKFSRVLIIGCAFLVVSTVMQYLVYSKFGGIQGYILAREIDGVDAFKGLGAYVLISESFPIVLSIVVVVFLRKKKITSFKYIYLSILLFVIIKMVFGGLAGSRSNIIWGLFWFAGMLHIFVRPFSKKQLGLALIFLMFFMAVYGVYKKHRSNFTEAIVSSGISDNNYYQTTNPMLAILLTDFSRADIQSYQIFAQDVGLYTNLRYGETYFNSLNRIIPIGKNYFQFDSKVQAGTEIIFHSEGEYSTRLYGLVGEFILNFPYFFYPLVFIPFGLIVISVHEFKRKRESDDVLLLCYPFLVNLCIIILIADSDNVLYFLLKNGLIPVVFIAIIMYLSPKRKPYEN